VARRGRRPAGARDRHPGRAPHPVLADLPPRRRRVRRLLRPPALPPTAARAGARLPPAAGLLGPGPGPRGRARRHPPRLRPGRRLVALRRSHPRERRLAPPPREARLPLHALRALRSDRPDPPLLQAGRAHDAVTPQRAAKFGPSAARTIFSYARCAAPPSA